MYIRLNVVYVRLESDTAAFEACLAHNLVLTIVGNSAEANVRVGDAVAINVKARPGVGGGIQFVGLHK